MGAGVCCFHYLLDLRFSSLARVTLHLTGKPTLRDVLRALEATVNPFRAPKSLPILTSSKTVPQQGSSSELISGALVRLTTCKRLTKSLSKLSLTTLSPPETAGIAGRPDIRADLSISKRFHFLGTPGRAFFKSDMGKV